MADSGDAAAFFQPQSVVWVRNDYQEAKDWRIRQYDRAFIKQNKQNAEPSEDELYRSTWLPQTVSAPPVWLPAVVLEVKDGQVRVKIALKPDPRIRSIPYEAALEEDGDDTIYPMVKKHRCDNLGSIAYLNKASVLNAIQTRFIDDKVHTFAGQTLVSVNPYKIVQMYGNGQFVREIDNDVVRAVYYKALVDTADPESDPSLLPHPFVLANHALERIDNPKNAFNQAILVNGQSGAGKSVVTQSILDYFFYVSAERLKVNKAKLTKAGRSAASGPEVQVLEMVRASLTLLDAFGNAATVHNDNASRYGKFVKIYFTSDEKSVNKGCVAGAKIEKYYLEASRAVSQKSYSRNFHIFYQLAKGMTDTMKQTYSFDFDEYNYVKYSTVTSDIDYEQGWKDTIAAMKVIGIHADYATKIQGLLIAILRLGNLTFTGPVDEKKGEPTMGAPAKVVDQADLKAVCILLGIQDTSAMETALTCKQFKTPSGQSNPIAFDVAGAEKRRDSLAKALYTRLFDWLVIQCNHAIDHISSKETKDYCIGVVDFFGFEDTDAVNSLEQMLINYSAEKFQQFYNEKTFRREAAEYEAEGIEFEPVRWDDNTMVVKLFEGTTRPSGLFNQLQGLGARQKLGPEQETAFVNKIGSISGGGAGGLEVKDVLEVHKAEKDTDPSFRVHHRNGHVTYMVNGILRKNCDDISTVAALKNMEELMHTSRMSFIKEIFEFEPVTYAGGSKPAAFLTQSFMQELNHLLKDELGRMECHFVRCILPNKIRASRFMEPDMVNRQLNTLNVSNGVRFQQVGFPIRRGYRSFFLDCILAVEQPFEDRKNNNLIKRFQQADKPTSNPKEQANQKKLMKQLCQEVLDLLWKAVEIEGESIGSMVQFGRTKVFMKAILPDYIKKAKFDHDKKMTEKAKILQKTLRMYLARQVFKKTVDSIVEVQSQYKAYMHYTGFREKVKAITTLQENIKTHIARKHWTLKRNSAKTMTHSYRAYVARVRWKRIRYGLYVVHWLGRGFLLRCHLLRYMWAIKTLQRAIRSFLMRNRNKWHKIVAGLTIQSQWRGYRVRCMRPDVVQYLDQKRVERHRSNMIHRLFATFRGNLVAARFDDIRASASALQNIARTRYERSTFVVMRRSAVKAQSVIRMFLAKAVLQRKRTAELIRIEQWRIKTLREREALLLAKYNQWMDSDQVWQRLAITLARMKKAVMLDKVVDVDILLDTSEMYPSGWMDGFTRLQHNLHKHSDAITSVAVGNAHSAVCSDRGEVYSWGWGDRGQLGIQKWTNETAPCMIKWLHNAPTMKKSSTHQLVDVTQNVKVSFVCCGQDHTVVLAESGRLYSWGGGQRGQLGHGDNRDRNTPTLIKALRRRVAEVACGATHTIALMSGGSVYTWGGSAAQLGTPKAAVSNTALASQRLVNRVYELSPAELRVELADRDLPTAGSKKVLEKRLRDALLRDQRRAQPGDRNLPHGIKFSRSSVQHIASGWQFTMALTHNGEIFTWGFGKQGQLGDGKFANRQVPSKVLFPSEDPGRKEISTSDNTDIVLVSPGKNRNRVGRITTIAAGARHGAALSNTGKVYMWGHNKCGQLGLGDREDRCAAVLVTSLSKPAPGRKAVTVSQIACGWRHTMCLSDEHEVYVWGHALGFSDHFEPGDMVHDETQVQYLSPEPVFLTEKIGRFPVGIAVTWSPTMSVSSVTFRQDSAELVHIRELHKHQQRAGAVSPEKKLAMQLLEDVNHTGEAEMEYDRASPGMSRSTRARKAPSPSRGIAQIPKEQLEHMGQQQLLALVEMLKSEDAEATQLGGDRYLHLHPELAAKKKWGSGHLGEQKQEFRSHHSGALGLAESAQEKGWHSSMHGEAKLNPRDMKVTNAEIKAVMEELRLAPSDTAVAARVIIQRRQDAANAQPTSGIRARMRYEDRRKAAMAAKKQALAEKRMLALKDLSPQRPAVPAAAPSPAEPTTGVREADVEAYFSGSLAAPAAAAAAAAAAEAGAGGLGESQLDLFRKYKNSPSDAVPVPKPEPPPRITAPKDRWTGRTQAAADKRKREIEREILTGKHTHMLDSSFTNTGGGHTRAYFKGVRKMKRGLEKTRTLGDWGAYAQSQKLGREQVRLQAEMKVLEAKQQNMARGGPTPAEAAQVDRTNSIIANIRGQVSAGTKSMWDD